MEIYHNSKKYIFCGYLIICFMGIASNLSSLFGDFVFDDTEAILNNADVLPSTPVSSIFANDYWGTNMKHNLSHKSYRPLTILTFRLNYILLGGLKSWSFHLVNIALHAVICMLIWSVFSFILGKKRRTTGFFGALLFSVHPVHTEAVSGIVGRAELLSALFFFLSFLAFTKSNIEGKRGKWVWLLISILLAAISMFCKEQGITVIGILSLYDIFITLDKLKLVWKPWCYVRFNNKSSPHINSFIVRQFTLIICAFVLVSFRYYIMNFDSPPFQVLDNPASFEKDWFTRVLSYNYIFCLNLWLLLCPEWLCFDWSMGCIPIVNCTDKRIIFVLIFWLSIAFLLWRTASLKNSRRQRDILMSLSLMVVPFLPASNIFFRVGFVLAERTLYIPSAGFCLLIACGVELLIKTFPLNKSGPVLGFAFLLVIYLIRSKERSAEWTSEGSLFNSGLRVCPLNAKVHYNVAVAALNGGDTEKAISEYKEAVRLYPDYYQAYNNLANILKNNGDFDEAEQLLRRALSIHEEFPAAWMNLGVVLAQNRNFKGAEECYLKALKYRKNYPDCYYNLGKLRLEENRLEEAGRAWTIAVKLKPTFTLAWNNLIILTSQSGNHSEAVTLAEKALASVGDEASIHFNMANALGKLARYPESEVHFTKAIQIQPSNPQFLTNLAVLYHRWRKYDRAERYYREALKIQPDFKAAIDNYKLLQKNLMKGNAK